MHSLVLNTPNKYRYRSINKKKLWDKSAVILDYPIESKYHQTHSPRLSNAGLRLRLGLQKDVRNPHI